MPNRVSRMVPALILVALIGLAAFTPARAAPLGPDPFPGIRGADQREMIDSWESPWSAIGRINIAGFRQTSMCTGTLIAPDVVITAAHCLFNRITGNAHPVDRIHFVAGVRRDEYLANTTVACIAVAQDYRFNRKPLLSETRSDMALLYLKEPISGIPSVPTVDVRGDVIATGPFFASVGYYRDRPFLPSIHRGCEIISEQDGIWLTNCNTNYGGSGGPALIEIDGEARVAAVVIGATEDKYSIAIPISSWPDLQTDNACVNAPDRAAVGGQR